MSTLPLLATGQPTADEDTTMDTKPSADLVRRASAPGRAGSARAAEQALQRAASALAPLVPEDFTRKATTDEALAILARLSMQTGWRASGSRRAAIALALVQRGYTRGALEKAGDALAFDRDLTRALRFPEGTVTPADFARMIDGASGAAPEGRLYTHFEMCALVSRTPGMTTAAFTMVEKTPGQPNRWRKTG